MEFMGNKPDTISNLKEKYKDGDDMAFAKKAEDLSKDTRFINYYNIEEMHEAEKQDFYHTGVEAGKLEGEHQRSIEVAKKMLEAEEPVEKISVYTNLTLEEISNLKESSNKNAEEE